MPRRVVIRRERDKTSHKTKYPMCFPFVRERERLYAPAPSYRFVYPMCGSSPGNDNHRSLYLFITTVGCCMYLCMNLCVCMGPCTLLRPCLCSICPALFAYILMYVHIHMHVCTYIWNCVCAWNIPSLCFVASMRLISVQ